MSLLFGLWPLLMSCLGVFAVTPAARGDISKDSTPRHNSPGLLYGSLVLVYSSLKNDSFRLCMMTYKPNTNLTTEGQINLLTSSRNSSYREMVQGFDAETARRHNNTYRAIAWLFRGRMCTSLPLHCAHYDLQAFTCLLVFKRNIINPELFSRTTNTVSYSGLADTTICANSLLLVVMTPTA
uniref:Putative salivary lipocalin n=1 Tax=Ixodes ricinus TaxID=34613 RepID=A0A6B0UZ87_IXORI